MKTKRIRGRQRWVFATLFTIVIAINAFATPPAQAQDPASEIFQLVNNFRASLGLPAFTWNSQLSAASQTQANWLLANPRSFVHTWPDGTTKEMRAVQAGYNGRVVENIVGGWDMTPQRALTWWQNSPPHYNTITSSFYTEAGTAFAGSGNNKRYVIVVGNRGASSAVTTSRAAEPEPILVAPFYLAEPDDTGQIIHTAGVGHALWTIAAYYDVDVTDLLLFNNMGENDLISVGDEIIVQPGEGWVPPPTPTPSFSVTVQEGQTLWTIAAIHNVDLADILLFNGLEANSLISRGDEIKIRLRPGEAPPTFTPTPTPVQKYTIREGDSAWSIAARFGITLDELTIWNDLSANPLLSVGQELWVISPSLAQQINTSQDSLSAEPTSTPTLEPDEATVIQLPTATPIEPTVPPTEAPTPTKPVQEIAQVSDTNVDDQNEAITASSPGETAPNWPMILLSLAALFLIAGGWLFYQSRELS